MKRRQGAFFVVAIVAGVLCMGPGRCAKSTGGFFSGNPAPDVRGDWDITYDDTLNVEVDVGGELYTGTIAGTAGSFAFEHDGEPYELEIDCSEPAVVCPSEIFPESITLEQRNFEERPHQVHMPASETSCVGETRLPDEEAGECGGETGIPCDLEICEGTVVEREQDALGSISDPEASVGDRPDYTIAVALGARISGFVTSYGACVGLAGSEAEADIEYSGTYDPESNNMSATALRNGEIVIAFGGACLIAAAGGGAAGAAVAGARVRIWTGFEAERQ